MRRVGKFGVPVRCRAATTGEYHHYQPGPFARAFRAIVATCTPSGLRKRIASRLTTGLERVEQMEKEAQWIKVHGSPLAVMGLPEHAELAEVKNRYTDLLFETHPDTAIAGAFGATDAAVAAAEAKRAAIRAGTLSDDGKMLVLSDEEQRALDAAAARAERRRAEDFALLQEAHAMIVNPDSVWHLNGGAPHILQVIRPPTSLLARVATPVRVVAVTSNLLMSAIACAIIFLLSPAVFQMLLEKLDPALHEWSLSVKAEDDAREAAGIAVDRDDVTRYASPKVQRMLKPGKAVQRIQASTAAAVEDDITAAVHGAVASHVSMAGKGLALSE